MFSFTISIEFLSLALIYVCRHTMYASSSEIVAPTNRFLRSHCDQILNGKFDIFYSDTYLFSDPDIRLDINLICTIQYYPERIKELQRKEAIYNLTLYSGDNCENGNISNSLDTYYLDPVLNFPASDPMRADRVRSKILMCLLENEVLHHTSYDQYTESDMIIIRNTIDYISGFVETSDTITNILSNSVKFSYSQGPSVESIASIPEDKYKYTNIFDHYFGNQVTDIRYKSHITADDTLGMTIANLRSQLDQIPCSDPKMFKDYVDKISLTYSCFMLNISGITHLEYYNYKFNVFYKPNLTNVTEVLYWYGLNRADFTGECIDFMTNLIDKREPYLDSDYAEFKEELEILMSHLEVTKTNYYNSFFASYESYRTKLYYKDEKRVSQLKGIGDIESTCI